MKRDRVELWAPVPFQANNRISLEFFLSDGTKPCILLSRKEATDLGVRLIGFAAIKTAALKVKR